MTRDSLLDHVVDVIAEEGMSGLSVRAVAARAGVAIGTVQHWFPTKSAMLLAAMDRIGGIAEAAGAAVRTPGDPVAELHGTIRLLVPSTPQSPVSRVWLAFAAHTVADPDVQVRYAQLWAGVHRGLAGLLAAARPSASAAAIDEAAAELVALTDGLAVAVIAEPSRMPPDRAAALARRRTDELLAALA
ncbi:TetR family transcriptional regulator C-terminal domain-containing protein [Microbacterium resistens]|uniref:TetR family transcriptional regulator C-terminal domain-containing protein n=1 Tax=Microbacterium resistens TaxID=156977 RepID=A0ABY3RSI9_9MICO|nr:TetR family transcriptional regulator C-terminal domain-containing protein [Microbacterium resistens]UGS25913.1 TetR family transcriptional regulator C-terminal domain-containing protein [Microbacterium resistens]